ncbi:hypothetical protein RB597_000157 [Gaeumannomyces tritici]
MPPHAPRLSTAPPTGPARSTPTATPTTAAAEEQPPPIQGPHPGLTSVPNQYCIEQELRRMQRATGCDQSRETSYRLQGIYLIENVRLALRLPVKTFDTACIYYHMFRLCFRDAEYNFQDAALTALFVACKVEDTIKKSKEILCAAYNLKTPDHPTTQDDKMFDQPTKIVIGLERHILQTIGFDFRVRYPQKYLIKTIRKLFPPKEGREVLETAYPMCTDIFKTFAPVKQTTFTMVMAIVELATLLISKHQEVVRAIDLVAYHTDRGSVVETMLDLLDLYAHFARHTKVGARFDIDHFIQVKIKINQEVEANPALERFMHTCERCEQEERDAGLGGAMSNQPLSAVTPGSATSPATTGSGGPSGAGGGAPRKSGARGQEGTLRFSFDAEAVRKEKEAVAKHFAEEFEEYEVELEEEVRESSHHGQNSNSNSNNNSNSGSHRSNRNGHSHGHGPPARGHGSRRERADDHRDSGWPYPRGRRGGGGGGHDRHKGRKGGGGGGGGGRGGYY